MKNILITLFLLFCIQFCFAANLSDQNIHCANKQVLGNIETIEILDNHLMLNAKLDTGAMMSSLSAKNIEIFKQGDQPWVRFSIEVSPQQKYILQKPLISYTYIRKRKEESLETANQSSKRPVIVVVLCVGNQKENILVNLVDRSAFNYPMLLGSDALQKFKVLVDVSQKHLTTPQC